MNDKELFSRLKQSTDCMIALSVWVGVWTTISTLIDNLKDLDAKMVMNKFGITVYDACRLHVISGNTHRDNIATFLKRYYWVNIDDVLANEDPLREKRFIEKYCRMSIVKFNDGNYEGE